MNFSGNSHSDASLTNIHSCSCQAIEPARMFVIRCYDDIAQRITSFSSYIAIFVTFPSPLPSARPWRGLGRINRRINRSTVLVRLFPRSFFLSFFLETRIINLSRKFFSFFSLFFFSLFSTRKQSNGSSQVRVTSVHVRTRTRVGGVELASGGSRTDEAWRGGRSSGRAGVCGGRPM